MQVEEYSHFFKVKLEQFSGPIDLLLHLVKQRELPIEKLSLAQVTSQYLECIENAGDIDLDIAGEYLVIAATLISIKSSILLADPVELVADEDGNLFDPHEELLRRLREAEVYKEGAELLGNRDYLGLDVFAPPPSLKRVKAGPVKYRDHDPLLLGKAFRDLLEKADKDSAEYLVTLESVSIVELMVSMVDQLQGSEGKIPFEDLIPDKTSRSMLIGSFVAMLELCKRQIVRVKQDHSFGEIFIVLVKSDTDTTNFDSELDEYESQAVGFEA